YDQEVEKTQVNREKSKSTGPKVVTLRAHTNAGIKVIVYEPQSYNEVTEIIEELKNRKLIVINMLGLDSEIKRNVFHCLSGAIYAIEGHMQKVAKDIFVLAPSNVEVDTNKISEEISGRGIFPWQK